MEQLKLWLIILLLVDSSFGQDQPMNEAGELDIAQIKEKAKLDALSDFDLENNVGWWASSLLLSVGTYLSLPIANESKNRAFTIASVAGLAVLCTAAYKRKVHLPPNREQDILMKSQHYGTIYRSEYDLVAKRRRFKYSLLGPAVLGLTAGLRIVRNYVLGGAMIEPESQDGDDN